MVKRWSLLLATFLLATIVTGCAQKPENVTRRPEQAAQTVKLYFANEDNERLITEDRQVVIGAEENKYTAVLRALIKGPENDNYRINISQTGRQADS